MELVGRELELAAVSRALDEVRDGGSRVIAVLGEAGIGKSALLAAIAARATGLTVVAARAAEHERDLPFALTSAALEPHVRTVGRVRTLALAERFGVAYTSDSCALSGDTNAAERYRFHRVKRAFVEQLGPTVLLFDDVQWADDASLELLLHLLTRPPEVPHLLVFALRPATNAAPLFDAARRRAGFEQLSLAPLDEDASRALLGDVDDRERLVRAAAGVPLYLSELARSDGAAHLGFARVRERGGPASLAGDDAPIELPATLQAAVWREVDALGDLARTLLRGAAVAGDPFDPELAATAAGLATDAAALDALATADLVRPRAGARGFAFRHPLVRRAVYDATPPAWRLAAHERVAAALEARGAGAAVRAYHVAQFARAGDGAAVELLRRAAEAASRSSPATAANWYAAALPLVPEAERSSLVGPLALSLASAGRLEESLAHLQEALAIDSGDRELILACARVESLRGRYAQARRRLHAAYVAAPDATLAFELAAAAMTANDAAALHEWAETTARLAAGRGVAADHAPGVDAVGHAAAAGDRAAPCDAALGLGRPAGLPAALTAAARVFAALADAWRGQRADGADLLAPLDALGDTVVGAHPTLLLHTSRALMRLERNDDAAALLKRAVAIGRGTSSGEMLVWLLGVQAWMLWLQLDLDGALAAAEAAEATARLQSAPNPLLLALSVRAAIHHDRGETLEAQRAAADCGALIAAMEPSDTSRMAAATLASLHAHDDPERCLAELDQVDLDPSWAGRSALVRVRAALAAGRVDDADGFAREAAARAAAVALPLAAIRAETGTAEVLLAQGEPEAAAALAEAAANAAEGRTAPVPTAANGHAGPARAPSGADRAAANGHTAPGLATTTAGSPADAARSRGALDAAEARLLQGRALAAAGRPEAAKAVFQRVAADAARGGATRLVSAASRELRGLGTRVSAHARRNERAELSAREREIAHLVATGNSNKQVAATLYLSEKTIENALTRVYAKLGVRSRTQLARAFD